MMLPKQPKVVYSEIEAAEMLGMTVEQLRSLVKNHIVKDDADSPNITAATFQASDLVVLRILAAQQGLEKLNA